MSAQFNYEQAIQARQNKFIETRTIIDMEINKFIKSLESLGEECPQECRCLLGKTTQDILPALWAEDFDEAQYITELQNYRRYEMIATEFANRINEEANKCLQLSPV